MQRKDQEMERERSIRKAEDGIKVSEFGGLVVANICLNSGFIKSWQHWETFFYFSSKFQVYFRMELIYEIVLHFQFTLKLLINRLTLPQSSFHI